MAAGGIGAVMDKKWYIVHAYSNFERKVADSIREKAQATGLAELFDEILVPTEKVVEVRRGRKVDAERNFFPGYVLVKMQMTDEAYHLIKNTPKVTGFLGAGKTTMAISETEAKRILQQVQEGVERPKPSVSFEVGEQVRVADGPFASFNGLDEEVEEVAASGAAEMGVAEAHDGGVGDVISGAPVPAVVIGVRAELNCAEGHNRAREAVAMAPGPGSDINQRGGIVGCAR